MRENPATAIRDNPAMVQLSLRSVRPAQCATRSPAAMDWAPDWEHRVDFMLRNGLLVRVEGMVIDDVVAVYYGTRPLHISM